MKRFVLAAVAAAIVVSSAFAQPAPQGAPVGTLVVPAPGYATIVGGQIGAPTYVVPPAPASGGIIDIGQAFSQVAAPYINAAVNALILALVGWAFAELKKKTGIAVDEGHRDALVTALQNQAGSLIADGEVKLQGATVTVGSAALARSANDLLSSIPDAAKHFGLTPEYVAKRIIDTVPQIAAGAQMVASSKSVAPAVPILAPKPA